MMPPERREAALQAAVRAVEAARTASGEFRGTRSDEVLEERLGPFDWSSFDSPGYALLRDINERAGVGSGGGTAEHDPPPLSGRSGHRMRSRRTGDKTLG